MPAQEDIVAALNAALLGTLANTPNKFPLTITIKSNSKDESSVDVFLDSHNIPKFSQSKGMLVANPASREQSDIAIDYLHKNNLKYELDYTSFAPNPTKLSISGCNELSIESLRGNMSQLCQYSRSEDISITSKKTPGEFSVGFINHIDADIVFKTGSDSETILRLKLGKIERPELERNKGSKIQLATKANSKGNSTTDENAYDALVIENFSQVLEEAVSLDVFRSIIAKFALFHDIDLLCFPVANEQKLQFSFKRAGFIGFARNKDCSKHLLECLYFLNDMTLHELLAFSERDIHDIQLDLNVAKATPNDENDTPRLKLAICQRKHGHYLYDIASSLALVPGSSINDPENLKMVSALPKRAKSEIEIEQRFAKSLNYQETNIYVNNLPVLFNDDDRAWHQFWNQFGKDSIKSAKIIKPQFYSKKSESSCGKFGFVFYEDFKTALRAIILTNDKVVDMPEHSPIIIQASFAIQKRHGSHSERHLPHAPQLTNFPTGMDDNFIPLQMGGGSQTFDHHHASLQLILGPGTAVVGSPENYLMYLPYFMPVPAYPDPRMAPAPSDPREKFLRRFSEGSYAVPGFLPFNGYYYYPYSGPESAYSDQHE